MAKSTTVLKVKANIGDDRFTEGLIQVQYLSKPQRIQKAFLNLFLWWMGAAASILLPVVHFVTVPVLFSLGIFFCYRTFISEGRVLKGEATCPHCKYKATVRPQQLNWPLKEICQGCARVLRMEAL